MELDKKQLEQILSGLIAKDRKLQNVLGVVKANAGSGKIWIIGSWIYKNLIKSVYGTNGLSQGDYDFIAETPNTKIRVPFGWVAIKNIFGNPKFLKIWGGTKADFIPLKGFDGGNLQGDVDISCHLKNAPLTIQSVAYDIQTGRLEGERGIESIESKIVLVNNQEELKEAARKRGLRNSEAYVQKVLAGTGFSYRL